MDDCLFCKIINKEIPALVIYEDASALAFLDIAPRVEGHAVIIPKHHAATLVDLPESEVRPLFSAVRSVAGILSKSLQAEGLTIGVNQGAVSGQVVPHLHVHVMPRFGNDGGGSVQSVVHNPPKDSLEDVRIKILAKEKGRK
jgi:histidine triad (HIT) family protein